MVSSGTLPRLLLASSSPNRLAILEACGVEAFVQAADIDEQPEDHETAAALTLRLAGEKCAAVLASLTEGSSPVVVAADTVVECDSAILGKPVSRDEAFRVLTELSGRSHDVVTSVAVGQAGRIETAESTTKVTFRELSDREICRYVDAGDYRGKAGSYAIQGMASMFVERIEGSYHNVVGLPTHTLELLLSRFGFSLADWRGV